MKKIFASLLLAASLFTTAKAQQKMPAASQAYDNIHLEKMLRTNISQPGKFALMDKEWNASSYRHSYATNWLTFAKPANTMPQYDFSKGLQKMNRIDPYTGSYTFPGKK